MRGLSGDTKGVTDLLPRPADASRPRHLLGLDLLGEPAQGQHRPQADGWVVAGDGCLKVAHLHASIKVDKPPYVNFI
jgi:hypothetical protein